MNGILFKPDIWQAKKKVLEQTGLAVTRRLDHLKEINQEPDKWVLEGQMNPMRWSFVNKATSSHIGIKPRYHPGQVVYVREGWAYGAERQQPKGIIYKLDRTPLPTALQRGDYGTDFAWGKWASPYALKAVDAHSFLQVVSVRPDRFEKVEQLTPTEMMLEGGLSVLKYLREYEGFWTWRIELKQVDRPEVI